jgi:hypothetical protein
MRKPKPMVETTKTMPADTATPVDAELAELVHVIATQFKGDTSAFFASRIQNQADSDDEEAKTPERCLVRRFRKDR